MPRSNGRGRAGISIRTQLVLSNILALTALIAVLGAMVHYAVRSTIMASVDRQLENQTEGMAHQHPPGPPPGGPMFPGSPFDRGFGHGGPPFDRGGDHGPPSNALLDFPALMHWQNHPPGPDNERNLHGLSTNRPHRFGLDGLSLDTDAPYPVWSRPAFLYAKQGRTVLANIRIDGVPYRLISRPFPLDGPPEGVLQQVYSLSDIDRALRGIDRALLMLSPVALLCAGAAGYLLTGRVLVRVRRMTSAASSIGSTNFSERIPVVGNDEFSELAGTFNALLGRLEAAIKRQTELNERQRRFIADASHELKSPVTIIKGNVGIALKTENCGPDVRESMEEIDQAVTAMSTLVRDLLLLAESDEGGLGRGPRTLSIADIVRRAVLTVDRNDAASIAVDVEEPAPTVLGNDEELTRLFSNLLSNAVKHTPATGSILVSALRQDDDVCVTVKDTGIGIAPEHLPHLGERFYRVDSARSRQDGGTGLGLSICKGIVQAHHGTMAIDSTAGVGTTVTVRLPLAMNAE